MEKSLGEKEREREREIIECMFDAWIEADIPESIKKLKTSLADLLQIATACSKQEPKQE